MLGPRPLWTQQRPEQARSAAVSGSPACSFLFFFLGGAVVVLLGHSLYRSLTPPRLVPRTGWGGGQLPLRPRPVGDGQWCVAVSEPPNRSLRSVGDVPVRLPRSRAGEALLKTATMYFPLKQPKWLSGVWLEARVHTRLSGSFALAQTSRLAGPASLSLHPTTSSFLAVPALPGCLISPQEAGGA